jgi:peptidoglycan hydrolase CwlO-like protein
MRIFNQIRTALTDNTELRLEISKIKHAVEKINKKQEGQDKSVELIFEFIDRLQDKLEAPAPSERKSIGYKIKGK